MKLVILNKIYNTEASTLLHSWNNEKPTYEPEYLAVSLYTKKTTGEYFIVIDRQAKGPIPSWLENKISWKTTMRLEGVAPLKAIEAKQWAFNHMETKKYTRLFINRDIQRGRKSLAWYNLKRDEGEVMPSTKYTTLIGLKPAFIAKHKFEDVTLQGVKFKVLNYTDGQGNTHSIIALIKGDSWYITREANNLIKQYNL